MDASGLCSRTRIQSHAIHIRFLWCMDSSGSDVHETLVWPIFQWANGVFRQDWACFFHCSMDRLISAWYHSSLPLPLRTPGHLIHLAIKRTRCMCASFPLLGFIWICSLGGPGVHFISYQAFVLLWTLLAITYTCVLWQNGYWKILMPFLFLFLLLAFFYAIAFYSCMFPNCCACKLRFLCDQGNLLLLHSCYIMNIGTLAIYQWFMSSW